MEHIAIMKKSWKLTPKILSGDKKIESRWYKFKHQPWNNVRKGEVVYFKDSGEPISIKAEVDKVLQFSDLTPIKVMEILKKYGRADGLAAKDLPGYYRLFRDKKYCLLIFLTNPVRVKPFNVDKKGFGTMASWLSVKNVKEIIL